MQPISRIRGKYAGLILVHSVLIKSALGVRLGLVEHAEEGHLP
jgi:hypothetical protein